MKASATPHTAALRQVLADSRDHDVVAADLLFLEAWEMQPQAGAGIALRVGQIRRANPQLAAAIRTELETARRTRIGLGARAAANA